MPLFWNFLFVNIHSYITITLRSSFTIRRPFFLNPHRVFAQQGEPPWDAEPRFELGPALQQADALPTELRRILYWPCTLNHKLGPLLIPWSHQKCDAEATTLLNSLLSNGS